MKNFVRDSVKVKFFIVYKANKIVSHNHLIQKLKTYPKNVEQDEFISKSKLQMVTYKTYFRNF